MTPKAFLLSALLATPALAAPPVGSDPALAPWFRSLQQPGSGLMCCTVADCRPVKTRAKGANIEAFIDRVTFGEAAPNTWVLVPPNVMIRGQDNPLGEPVLCFYGGEVRCFVDGAGT